MAAPNTAAIGCVGLGAFLRRTARRGCRRTRTGPRTRRPARLARRSAGHLLEHDRPDPDAGQRAAPSMTSLTTMSACRNRPQQRQVAAAAPPRFAASTARSTASSTPLPAAIAANGCSQRQRAQRIPPARRHPRRPPVAAPHAGQLHLQRDQRLRRPAPRNNACRKLDRRAPPSDQRPWSARSANRPAAPGADSPFDAPHHEDQAMLRRPVRHAARRASRRASVRARSAKRR